jgi:tetratricopeptide (TPR) repeat protein
MLEHLQRLPIEVVQGFLESRDAKSAGIKPALANYILQINDAYNLSRKYRNVSECARQLLLLHRELESLPTAKGRVYDAIEFFNANCTVTAPAWNSYYADVMKNLADINLVAQDLKEARRCYERAIEYDLAASANRIDPRRIQFKHQVVSPDIHLPRMGITPVGILRAWEEAKAIIKSRDISKNEKERLILETGRELDTLKYTDYEEIED